MRVGYCPACEYDLSGLGAKGSALCPECGAEVVLPGVEWGAARMPRVERRSLMAFFATPLWVLFGSYVAGWMGGLCFGWAWSAWVISALVRIQQPRRHWLLLTVDAIAGGFVWVCLSTAFAAIVVAVLGLVLRAGWQVVN